MNYHEAPVKVRGDILAAHKRAWDRLARSGTWLDGARRVAIAAETRNATGCSFCRLRKEALSPNSVTGTHDSLGDLPDTFVEVVHRVVTDPSRLSSIWYSDLLKAGIEDVEYIETVGVVTSTVAIDTFARAIGMPAPLLPSPIAGPPKRQRPRNAKTDVAWVPMIVPDEAAPEDADIYAKATGNVRRALSLVPDEVRGFFDLCDHHYLDGLQIADLETDPIDTGLRAISRSQIELVATRVSTLNQCFY